MSENNEYARLLYGARPSCGQESPTSAQRSLPISPAASQAPRKYPEMQEKLKRFATALRHNL